MRNNQLTNFRGDTRWIHDKEGSSLEINGRSAYWPRGSSGVTLDPGFDLGYHSTEELRAYYGKILSIEELEACESVLGLRGQAAHGALFSQTDEGKLLRGIEIPEEDQQELFPMVASSYWDEISDRFEVLRDQCTPAPVQTALLSLAYNRGPQNGAFKVLAGPLAAESWKEVGWAIAQMQQDHNLRGIRKRRRREGALVVQPLLTPKMAAPHGSLKNAALRNAQEFLQRRGFYEGTVDAIYGPGTREAVEEFQQQEDLEYIDGMIGPETWRPLVSADG